MYRGTTPIVVFIINSPTLNLSDMKQIWITFKDAINEITYSIEDLIINSEEKTIKVEMSQEDTLKFYSGTAKTQIRFLDNSGVSYASNVKQVKFDDILKEGVING